MFERPSDLIRPRILLVSSYPSSASSTHAAPRIADDMRRNFRNFTVRCAYLHKNPRHSSLSGETDQKDLPEISLPLSLAIRKAAACADPLILQPLLLMKGAEYQHILSEAARASESFYGLHVADPLLSSPEDHQILAGILTSYVLKYHDDNTAVCFIGHGSSTESNSSFELLEEKLQMMNGPDYYVGTLLDSSSRQRILDRLRASSCTRILLCPLMLSSGIHIFRDIAGLYDTEEENISWYDFFISSGYSTLCIPRGIGHLPGISEHFQRQISRACINMNRRDLLQESQERG